MIPWNAVIETLLLFRTRLISFAYRILSIVREPTQLADLYTELFELFLPWVTSSPGPTYVSPMASLTKRRSGRLAKLLLGHSRRVDPQETFAVTPRPSQPHSVVVIDIDNAPNSAKADYHGFLVMLLFMNLTLVLLVRWQLFWLIVLIISTAIPTIVLFVGNHNLTVVSRPGIPIVPSMSAPECTLLLEDDILVVLNGTANLVEGILEGRINHSLADEEKGVESWQFFREGMCIGMRDFIGVRLASLLYRPLVYPGFVAVFFDTFDLKKHDSKISGQVAALFISVYISVFSALPLIGILLPCLLLSMSPVLPGFRGRNYPVQPKTLLAILGHPQVKRWDFHSEAAAATFLSLILCRGFSRPVKDMDIPGVLELLIPDRRDVWRAWKDRVSDRIVHEEDILFAPTIPTFGDRRQLKLKELLDDAQSAYEVFTRFYRHQLVPTPPPMN